MKKRLYILVLALTACVISLQAQREPLSKDEFRRHQQEFLTKRAGLDVNEAKQFFPLYFELQDKKQEYNRNVWKSIRRGKETGTSDEEYAQIIEDVVQTRIDIDRMELEYVRKYKKILPPKKIYLIQKAEMRFHRELLRDMRPAKKKK